MKATIEQLRDELHKGVVRFTYLKKNGELRIAQGTLKSDLLPQLSGNGRPIPNHLQIYFDTDKGAFRSFEKDNLVSIEA